MKYLLFYLSVIIFKLEKTFIMYFSVYLLLYIFKIFQLNIIYINKNNYRKFCNKFFALYSIMFNTLK